MMREIPPLDGISLSPTKIKNLKPKHEYGEFVPVGLFCILPVLLIELYQKITVNKPHVCNFVPSCSEYSRIAYLRYGFITASRLTLERLRNCNYFTEWPHYNKP